MVVTGTYDPYLVILSIVVAGFASYTALDLGGHVGAAHGVARRAWLAAAAVTMGGGIWSMHFVAMLAFTMPVPMSYDVGLTSLSLLVAILVTGASFYIISRRSVSPSRLVSSGIFMGLGIAAMHYTGMAAMRGHADLNHERFYVALSLAVAICASTVALWRAFLTTDLAQKVVAAAVMGLAISGMHYTAMQGAIFTVSGPLHEPQDNAGLDQTTLALAVAGITFLILAFAAIVSLAEQRRAEEALHRARADLAHMNRVTTMGELTASLAHEVNQPITATLTNANVCLRWLSGSPPNLEEARACALNIEKDATRAGEIIGRIRLLLQKGAPQRQPVDVNDIIREVVVLLRGELAQHAISVRVELTAELPPILGDRVQLQQVLMNLVTNSIDAMKETNGQRELTVLSQWAGKGELMVCVCDTGVGLPPRQADQIFRAFFTTKPHGTGMGLSISRSIIESHGGRLWAAENSSSGAIFYVALPVDARI